MINEEKATRRCTILGNRIFWKKSVALAKKLCGASGLFQEIERFGMIAQLRKRVVSVSSTITDGFSIEKSTSELTRERNEVSEMTLVLIEKLF